jgi:WD40 repeat protein
MGTFLVYTVSSERPPFLGQNYVSITQLCHEKTAFPTLFSLYPCARCATPGEKCRLKLWDIETGQLLKTLESHSGSVWSVAIFLDGMRVLSASEDWMLKLWDLETGQLLKTLEGGNPSVTAIALLPDGRRALSGPGDIESVSVIGDYPLKLWDLETGQLLKTLEGHSQEITAVALLPDGRRALSASNDRTLKLWDLEAGQALKSLEGHSSSVLDVALLPDGRRALSASWDKTLKLWDLEAGAEVCTFSCDVPASCCAVIGADRMVGGDRLGRLYWLALVE